MKLLLGVMLLLCTLMLMPAGRAEIVETYNDPWLERRKSEELSPARREEAQKLFEEAFDHYQSGKYDEAISAFDRGRAIDPANVTALFFLADTLARNGDPERARLIYTKIIALEPNSENALKARGLMKAMAEVTPRPAIVQAIGGKAEPLTAERERALKPKDAFKECDQCPEMVVISSGFFIMGSDQQEIGRFDNEEPRRRVTLARNFVVGKFAVTFAEWDACKADGGCKGYSPPDNNWGRGRQPVIFVSWNDAKSYVEWLSRKSGKPYRLLSESEREYVSRGGSTTPFWWGPQISTELANYDGNFNLGDGPKGRFNGRPLPVDSFAPNPFGLYQVHGNVWEWLEDCSDNDAWKNYANAPSDGSPRAATVCKARFLRGGAWDDQPRMLRSAQRYDGIAKERNYAFGFRVARDLER